MKWKVTDWKFVLTSLLAVGVPFYFWQTDITAHSLSVRLISSSALELPTDSKVHNLQISVNGSKIEAPHIYSLALVNTGSKPILSADFETPIEIRTKNASKLVTAQITGSEPADIPAKMVLEGNKLKFLPFLSNPKDQITVTLVSSGPLDLATNARIVGVREITLEDVTQNQPRPMTAIAYGTVALACLMLYLLFLDMIYFRAATKVGPGIKILSTFVTAATCVMFASKTTAELRMTGGDLVTLMILTLFAIAWGSATLLSRRERVAG